MKTSSAILILLVLLPFWGLQGQSLIADSLEVDTSLMLQEVNIRYSPADQVNSVKHSTTVVVVTRDRSLDRFEHQDMATALRFLSSLGWKGYGPGQLATPTFRGTAARHTKVFWNGIELNSPLNGGADFSLIPFEGNTSYELLQSATAARNWASTAGGAILINPSVSGYGSEASLFSAAGSFGTWQLRTGYKFFRPLENKSDSSSVRKDFYSNSSLNWLSSQADFPVLKPALVGGLREHSAYSRLQFSQELRWRGTSGSWQIAFLGTSSDRELPAPLFATPNDEEQQDYRAVASLIWSRNIGKWFTKVQTAVLSDRTDYQNPIADIVAVHRAYRANVRTTADREWDFQKDGYSMRTSAVLLMKQEWGRSTGFDNPEAAFTAEMRPSVEFSLGQFRLGGTLAQSIFDGELEPFQPTFMLTQSGHAWFWNVSGGRHYTRPSWNDLFWSPGGNPNLDPELGWTANAQVRWKFDHAYPMLEVSGWWTTIDDWIQWTPGVDGLWAAQNLNEVETRGLQFRTRWVKSFEPYRLLQISMNGSYTYTDARVNDEGSLIYTPAHRAAGVIQLDHRFVGITWFQDYQSSRPYTTDGEMLAAYATSGIMLRGEFEAGDYSIRISATVDNLFNTYYEPFLNRPMPGRAGTLGFRLTWKGNVPEYE